MLCSAEAIWPEKRADLITDRRAPNEDLLDARREFARLGRWMLFLWGAAGAIGGLLVLVGILSCE